MSTLTPAWGTVIASIISGAVALIVCLWNSRQQQKRMMAEIKARDEQKRKDDAVRDAKLEVWIQGVNRKLDEHNGYADKLASIATDIAVIKNDIKTLYKNK